MAVEPDGQIVATAEDLNSGDRALFMFNSDGTLDSGANGFGPSHDGEADVPFASAGPVAIQAGGDILVAGDVLDSQTGGYDFALARYTSGGIQECDFGTNGVATADAGGCWVAAMALQPDGEILLAGTSYGGFAAACYMPGSGIGQTVSVQNTSYVAPGGLADSDISAAGVRYANGDVVLSADDLGSVADRAYSTQAATPTAGPDVGNGWQLTDVPEFINGGNQVIVSFGPQDSYWFNVNSGDTYSALLRAEQSLVDYPSQGLLVFTDTDGTVYMFYDAASSAHPADAFYQSIAPNGSAVVATWASGQLTQLAYQNINPADSSQYEKPYQVESFTYYAMRNANAGLVDTITLQNYNISTQELAYVSQVTYTYYDGTEPAFGRPGRPGDGRLHELPRRDR